jgi:hypothetical protein
VPVRLPVLLPSRVPVRVPSLLPERLPSRVPERVPARTPSRMNLMGFFTLPVVWVQDSVSDMASVPAWVPVCEPA